MNNGDTGATGDGTEQGFSPLPMMDDEFNSTVHYNWFIVVISHRLYVV